MKEQTKYELMKRREILKSYSALDAGWEESDETQSMEQPSIRIKQELLQQIFDPPLHLGSVFYRIHHLKVPVHVSVANNDIILG